MRSVGAAETVRSVTRRERGRARARVWWGGGSALAATVLMFCYLRVAGTTRVVSDGAGDVLRGWAMAHGDLLLHRWAAGDVSFWTTELPQYALVTAVAGLRPEVVHICAAITYTLLVLLAAYAARGRATGAEAAGRALLAAVILLAPEPGQGVYVLLTNPDHVGTGVPVLVVLLMLDLAPRRWWVPLVSCVLLTWGLLGDLLFSIVAVAPLVVLCLTRVVLAMRRSGTTIRDLWFELSLLAAAALAMIAARATSEIVVARGGFTVNPLSPTSGSGLLAHLPFNVRGVLTLFGADPVGTAGLWGADPGGVPGHTPSGLEVAFALVHLLGVAVVIAAVAVAARRLLRSLASPPDAQQDLASDLMVVSVLGNVAIFVALYRVGDVFAGREVGPSLSLGAALAGRVFGGPLVRAVSSGASRARTALRLFLVAMLACYCAMLGYAAAQPQVPPGNVALAGWLADHGLRSGLAGYWDATSVTLDSGGVVTMAAVMRVPASQRLAPYRWEMDMRLFDPGTHRANFLVISPYPLVTRKQAIKTFGQPARTYHYQAYTILVWHKNLLRDLGPPIG